MSDSSAPPLLSIPAAEAPSFSHQAALHAGWDNAASHPGNRFDRVELFIRSHLRYQKWVGLGGAFSAIGGEALACLPDHERERCLHALYRDANFHIGRVPVGANDFARAAYSLAPREDDWEMSHFSLDPDRSHLLPFLHWAQTICPGLLLHASPWSPPHWLKTNQDMCGGGSLLPGDRPRAALALYLTKYVDHMTREGFRIFRLCAQNEMDVASKYPSCRWDTADFAAFHHKFLQPSLQAAAPHCALWGGTFRSSTGVQALDAVVDAGFVAAVDGIALQYTRSEVMAALGRFQPELKLMHAESVCHNGDNSWNQAVALFYDFLVYVRGGCDVYTYWNTILPQDARSGWGWKQNSLVTINCESGTFRLNPDYHVLRWLSLNIPPGSVRIEAYSFHGPTAAFERPDGSRVALFFNPAETSLPVVLDWDGTLQNATLPPHGFGAFVFVPEPPIIQQKGS